MQFQRRFKAAIQQGDVTCSFRKWRRPQVKIGGQYNIHGYGAIEVTDVRSVRAGRASLADIKRSGFGTRAELLSYLKASNDDILCLVELHYLGPTPVKQPPKTTLSQEAVTAMQSQLATMDAQSKRGPWAIAAIKLIGRHPGRRAPELATMLSWETQPFKANVRKLKALGLTESLETGYRLSTRGKQVLDSL